jgi:hypothetical protein
LEAFFVALLTWLRQGFAQNLFGLLSQVLRGGFLKLARGKPKRLLGLLLGSLHGEPQEAQDPAHGQEDDQNPGSFDRDLDVAARNGSGTDEKALVKAPEGVPQTGLALRRAQGALHLLLHAGGDLLRDRGPLRRRQESLGQNRVLAGQLGQRFHELGGVLGR